jgi:hypothetical protein
MKHLITPAEVIDLAFSRHDRINPSAVTDDRIEIAQRRFLKPALGGLYPALTLEKYEDFLCSHIKPALAHFVRYLLLPHLGVQAGCEGIVCCRSAEAAPLDPAGIARLRKEARRTARTLLAEALEYLGEHADEFPEYVPRERCRPVEITGGVVM